MSLDLYLPLRAVRAVLFVFAALLVGSLIAVGAAQANSVGVTVANDSGHRLERTNAGLNYGSAWSYDDSVLPPQLISVRKTAHFIAFSSAVLKPVEGSVSYRIGDTDRVVRIYFKNPSFGANTYDCTPKEICIITGTESGVIGSMGVTIVG